MGLKESYLTEKTMEARAEVTCPRSHSLQEWTPLFELDHLAGVYVLTLSI